MTINPISAGNPLSAGIAVVVPVVDYEPPVRAIARCRLPGSVPPRRLEAPSSPTACAPSDTGSPALGAAARFADAALRRVLEVVDGRRPAAQLNILLTPALVDSVLSGRAAAPSSTGAAVLQRVRVRAAVPDHPPTAVEVFGSYRRGRRIHAVACRLEQVSAHRGPSWQIVALHIG